MTLRNSWRQKTSCFHARYLVSVLSPTCKNFCITIFLCLVTYFTNPLSCSLFFPYLFFLSLISLSFTSVILFFLFKVPRSITLFTLLGVCQFATQHDLLPPLVTNKNKDSLFTVTGQNFLFWREERERERELARFVFTYRMKPFKT